MNPPYLGKNRNDYNIHLKFLNKIVTISNNIISVQPIMFLFKTYDKKSPEQAERDIMNHNLVCSDFFKWDFENWRPIADNSVELF